MMKIPVVVISLFCLSSCAGSRNNDLPEKKPAQMPYENLNIQANGFIEIDTSGILMFPLTMGESVRAGMSVSYKEVPSGSFWNILFVNSKTNEQHLLSEQKMLIRNYDEKYDNESRSAYRDTGHIFYTVVTEDRNGDKLFNTEDPGYLFVSDRKGYQFRQVSPVGYDVRDWEYIKSSGKVFMIVAKDSDTNKKYDDKDELAAFEMIIDSNTPPVEVFSPALKARLRLLYDKHWKKIKK